MAETELFSILDSVDSTNNYAMAAIHSGVASHGMAWFANEQTAGKGQRGKQWHTGAGQNIALSIVLQPEKIGSQEPFKISVAVGLACYDFFSRYAGSEISIKWPNDLYWRDRKAGGILIENLVRGNKLTYSVAGIGLNINELHFDPELKNPVSLAAITNKHYNTVELARELYEHVMQKYVSLEAGDFGGMLESYNEHLYRLNQTVKLKKGPRIFETIVKAVSADGKLITGVSMEEEFDFGEVEFIL